MIWFLVVPPNVRLLYALAMMELYPTAENRLPEGAKVHVLKTADGVKLRAMTCGPALARGTILLMGGRADYLERYFETMRELGARGFRVASFDWRGQGGSDRLLKDRQRSHINNFKYYDVDLRTSVEQLMREHCPGPYYALGHSTGGHILLRNIVRETWFSKAIITAPLMDLHYAPWPRWTARLISYVYVRAGLSWVYLPGFARGPMSREDFDGNPLSSDALRWNRDALTLERYPQLGTGGPTMGWLNAAMDSFDRMKRLSLPQGPRCPVMVVLSGRDRVVNNAATMDFATRVPGLSQVLVDGSLHEIMHEQNSLRAAFFAALESYLDVPPLS